MKLSTRTRYGTRALVELAAAYPDEALPLRQVAAREAISTKYLEQIMRALKAAGLVRTMRGPRGGYALARPPADIKLSEVYEALDGPLAPVECLDRPGSCPRERLCPARETWAEMTQSIRTVLDGTTLQDLVERRRRKAGSPARMYYI